MMADKLYYLINADGSIRVRTGRKIRKVKDTTLVVSSVEADPATHFYDFELEAFVKYAEEQLLERKKAKTKAKKKAKTARNKKVKRFKELLLGEDEETRELIELLMEFANVKL